MIEPCPPPDSCRRLPTNPFATRFTRPGRLEIRDRDGTPLDPGPLVDVLDRLGGSAAIEGPHGSGKTTLLLAIADLLETRQRLARLVRLRSRRDARQALAVLRAAVPGSVLCIDSWEQAGLWTAAAIRRAGRRRAVGLLVTSHRATGLPVLHRGATSPTLLARLVADLPSHGGVITSADVAAAHVRHAGDLRAALFELYDRFEDRIR
jgi:hypothetical protein